MYNSSSLEFASVRCGARKGGGGCPQGRDQGRRAPCWPAERWHSKVEKHLMFWTWTEQDLSHLTKNLSIFNPKFFLKFSELYRLDQDPDLRSGIRDPAETYPRSESAILITSAVGILFQAWIETQQYCKTSIFSLEAFYSTFFAQPQIHTKKTASQESKRWGVMQYLPIQYRQAGMQQQMKKVEPIM